MDAAPANTRNKTFKIILITSLAMFCIATFCLIVLILGLADQYSWQLGSASLAIFYYGLMNIWLAKCYERSFSKLSSVICLAGLMASCLSFVITEFVIITDFETSSDMAVLTGILTAIVWFSLVYYLHLKTDNTDSKVVIVKDLTSGMLGLAFLTVNTYIVLEGGASSLLSSLGDTIFTRFMTIILLLSLLGLIGTKILNAVFRETRVQHGKAQKQEVAHVNEKVDAPANDTVRQLEELKRQQQELLKQIEQLKQGKEGE